MSPVTIVIPTYNRLSTLIKVLKGLEKQTIKNFQVIVADDGSSENINEEIAVFRKSFPLTYLRNSVNGGRASACNLGLNAVNTPLVVFLDDDLVPKPRWLEAHLSFHEKYPQDHFVTYGRISWGPLLKTSDLLVYLETRGRYKNCSGHDHEEVMWDLPTGNTSFKTGFLKKHQGFNAAFTTYGQEDLEFGRRLFKGGMICLFNARAFAIHLHQLDLERFLRLSEMDGYSSAFFQVLDPDFKWYQSEFIADRLAEMKEKSPEELKSVLEKEQNPERKNEIYGKLAALATFRGIEKYFNERFPEYPEFKRLIRTGSDEALISFLESPQILKNPLMLSVGCFWLEKRGQEASLFRIYEELLSRYPQMVFARKRFCERLYVSDRMEELKRFFVPSLFSGHPALEFFAQDYQAKLLIREGKTREAMEGIKKLMAKDSFWKKINLFHYSLASEFEKSGDEKNAAFLFRKIYKSRNLTTLVRGGAAFHLGRMLMEKRPLKALTYLREVLRWIPEHRKAREFLNSINGEQNHV